MLYLCSRELAALGFAGEWGECPCCAKRGGHEQGPSATRPQVWIQDDLLCFAELLFIFSHFYSADCHGNATASCGFSDGWAALAVLDQEELVRGRARATALGREVAAQCPTSGPAYGFGLRSEAELTATPRPGLSTAGNQTQHTNLSRRGFKCILGD